MSGRPSSTSTLTSSPCALANVAQPCSRLPQDLVRLVDLTKGLHLTPNLVRVMFRGQPMEGFAHERLIEPRTARKLELGKGVEHESGQRAACRP